LQRGGEDMQTWGEMFGVMNLAFPIFIVVILGIIIILASSSIRRYYSDNKQPLLIVQSTIIAKRTEVSHYFDSDTSVNRSDSTYYLTFEVEGGERLEFKVSGSVFGQHTEGDTGKLTFRGKRFEGFDRIVRSYQENLREIHRYDA
jgi:hypothetical protein